jgi:colanic acid/amylovoran biosynthesis glycosyltransferase
VLKEIPHSKKKNEIVFKIPEFPHISETFIIAQILTAIRLGYSIKIITRKLVNDNIRLIDNYDLQKNIIIENYNIPKNKIIRSLKWLGLLIQNFKNIILISLIKRQLFMCNTERITNHWGS